MLVSSRGACLGRRGAQSAKQIAVVLAGGRDVYGNRIQDGEGYAEECRDSTAWLDREGRVRGPRVGVDDDDDDDDSGNGCDGGRGRLGALLLTGKRGSGNEGRGSEGG